MTETATYSKNDVFYTCSLIEYIGRVTRNHRKDVVSALGTNGVKAILDSADVFHCQSFEQSADEICELFPVPEGTYDTVSNCHYKVPSYTDIGKVYQRIIFDCTSTPGVQDVIDVFSSFISDDISDFNTATYYCNPSYLYPLIQGRKTTGLIFKSNSNRDHYPKKGGGLIFFLHITYHKLPERKTLCICANCI